jgi:hypothetical protein
MIPQLKKVDVKRQLKKVLKSDDKARHGTDEMCPNCFVLEKGLLPKNLFRCGWCLLLSGMSKSGLEEGTEGAVYG